MARARVAVTSMFVVSNHRAHTHDWVCETIMAACIAECVGRWPAEDKVAGPACVKRTRCRFSPILGVHLRQSSFIVSDVCIDLLLVPRDELAWCNKLGNDPHGNIYPYVCWYGYVV